MRIVVLVHVIMMSRYPLWPLHSLLNLEQGRGVQANPVCYTINRIDIGPRRCLVKLVVEQKVNRKLLILINIQSKSLAALFKLFFFFFNFPREF
jgi:hypothetical protein